MRLFLAFLMTMPLAAAASADDITDLKMKVAKLEGDVDEIRQKQFVTDKKLDQANDKLDAILAAMKGQTKTETKFATPWSLPTTTTTQQSVVFPGTQTPTYYSYPQMYYSYPQQYSYGYSMSMGGSCANGSCGVGSSSRPGILGRLFGRR